MSAVLFKKDKEPFEKIRSNIEKRRVLSVLAREKSEVLCKGDGENLFGFIIDGYSEGHGLVGQLILVSGGRPLSGETLVANFGVGPDRYFMTAQYGSHNGLDLLAVPDSLYQLQRRSHNRVILPEGPERGVNIIKHNGKVVFARAQMHDISAGGCRVVYTGGSPQFSAGDVLTAVMHINDRWRIEVQGQIRHCQGSDKDQNFGVQFVNLNTALTQKLLMMMLELQRWAVQKTEAR